MRPIADIRVDVDAAAPETPDLAAWEAFCARHSDEELADLFDHDGLEIVTRLRGGGIQIPTDIATDPRLCARERYVLAAVDDVRRELDVATYPRIAARLFGEFADSIDMTRVEHAVSSMRFRGILARTRDGGFVRRRS